MLGPIWPATRRTVLLGAAGTAVARPALAQSDYPTRTVRIVIPFMPGGPMEPINRILADWLTRRLGQPFVVDNRPGATGTVGATMVSRSPPDGYTLLLSANTGMVVAPMVLRSAGYDPLRDFTPITGVAQVPNVLVMNPEAADRFGVKSVADLVAFAKKNPGKLNYGSGGNGSAGHLAGEMFKAQAGVFMVHIPYGGGNPAQLALLSGQVDLNFDNLASASANIKAGKLRALAVTTAKRSPAVPELPTIAESGGALAGFDIHTWFGLFGPARLPAEVTGKLNKAFVEALASPELKARLATLMAEPMPSTPDQFGAFVRAELAKYEGVVKRSGAKVD